MTIIFYLLLMSSVAAQLTRALVLLLLLVTMLAQCSALPVSAHLLVVPISGGGVGGSWDFCSSVRN